MNQDQPKKPKAGWRQGGKDQPAKQAHRGWKKAAGDDVVAPTGRWLKILAGFGGIVLLVGLLVLVLQWLYAIKPTALVLFGAHYEANLSFPPNTGGWGGLQDLSRWAATAQKRFFLSTTGHVTMIRGVQELRADAPIEQTWSTCFREVAEKNLIVVVAAHGGVDEQGKPFVLTNDANLRTDKERIYIEAILDQFKAMPDKNKTLILDAAVMPSHWGLGMMSNSFAHALRQLEPKIKDIKNLVVLVSADEDQVSWFSPDLRKTAFLHYVTEGLRGAADVPDKRNPKESGNGDGRVTAMELTNFVRRKVLDWARDNRAALQAPFLIGDPKMASDMTLVGVREDYKAPELPAETASLDKVAEAWSDWHALARQTQQAPPWTYAPHLWRLYTAQLLRYEELLRADQEPAANAALTSARSLLAKIKLQLPLKSLTAVGLSLPMDAAMALPSGMVDQPAFLDLAEKVVRERDQPDYVWKAVRNQVGEEARPVFVRYFMRYCLNRAIDNPQAHLLSSLPFIKLAEAEVGYRPAEVHFMFMLQEHPRLLKQPNVNWSVVKFALEIERLAAETAMGYDSADFPLAEVLWPVIQPLLKQGDEFRRHGHDHLFAGRFEEAANRLQQARQAYDRARREAKPLRAALLLRDRLSQELLWLSHWLPTLPEDGKPMVELAAEIWDGLHDLDRELTTERLTLKRDEKDQQAWMDQLVQKTQKLQQHYGNLEMFFHKQVDVLIEHGKQKADQFVYQQIDAILQVPMIKGPQRQQLLLAARKFSRELLQLSAARLEDAKDLPKEVQTAKTQLRAEREARLALAALGEDWMTQKVKNVDVEPYNNLLSIIKTRMRDDWPKALREMGPPISRRWILRADEVLALTPAANREDAIPKAMNHLALADRHHRLCEVSTLLQDEINPTEGLRRLRWHDVLLGMAERTYHDFWASDKADAAPYYSLAGKEFVLEARRFLEQQGQPAETLKPRLQISQALVETLEKPPPLVKTIDRPTILHITSERQFDCRFQLNAPTDMPLGFPFFWLNVPQGGSLGQSAESAQGHLLAISDKVKSGTVAFELINHLLTADAPPKPTDPIQTATLQLEGWYRGHRLLVPTPARIYPYPDIVMVEPFVPNVSSLVLRASDDIHKRFASDNSGIVFILDCSGSMRAIDSKTGKRRFDLAREALINVLARLPRERGPQVSIWCFAAKVDSGEQPDADEDTIQRLVGPVAWNHQHYETAVQRLNKLTPYGLTPLVRAMTEGIVDLQPLDGFKTLIVLTDGMDTCFEPDRNLRSYPDRKLNPGGKLSVVEFLTGLFNRPENKDIVVNIIGFQLPENEQPIAKRQFPDELFKQLPKPSEFVLVQDQEKVIEFLNKFRQQQLLYYLETEVGGRLITPEGVNVTVIPKRAQRPPNYPWRSLDPKNYLVYALERRLAQRAVSLKDGQLLLLDLVPDQSGDRPLIRRGLFADDYPDKPRTEAEQWLLAALQNQRLDERTQELFLTLESTDRGGRTGALQQPTPFFAWYELRPTDSSQERPRVRWGVQPLIPAPAWNLRAFWANLPSTLPKTELQVWWNSTQEPRFAARLERETSSTWEQMMQRPLTLAGNPCMVESIRFEEHELPSKRDQTLEKKPCLVIRMAFTPGDPVLVRPDMDIASALHFYYLEAGKYTGIFPIEETQANRRLGSMRVFSLAQFKKMDTTRTLTLPLDAPNQEERPFHPPSALVRP